MIDVLSKWIEQIIIAIIVVSIIELVLPKGNLKKYIKVVLGVYVMFCVISPITNGFYYDFKGLNFDKINILENNTVNSKSIDSRIQELYIEQIENDIKAKSLEYGFETLKCNVKADLNGESSDPGIHLIELRLRQKTIMDNKENTECQIKLLKEEIVKLYEIEEDNIKIKIK